MDDVSNTDSVMLDVDILDCAICTERLTTPIFQCMNGHFFCCRCFPKLGGKCPSCRSPISKIRCLAMEKIPESARPCPKAKFECTKMGEMINDETQTLSNAVEIIELSDDDNDSRVEPHHDPEQEMWFYECPEGKAQGPFSLTKLKEWNDDEYFDADFKVWMRGESIESAVLLTTLLPHINT